LLFKIEGGGMVDKEEIDDGGGQGKVAKEQMAEKK
jgi:hypothetical protein